MEFKKRITANDGSTIAAVDTSSSAHGRKWGIFRTVRLVKFPAGLEYKSSRSKGVEVLKEHEYDARSGVQTRRADKLVTGWFAEICWVIDLAPGKRPPC